jgi:hypothetical protein
LRRCFWKVAVWFFDLLLASVPICYERAQGCGCNIGHLTGEAAEWRMLRPTYDMLGPPVSVTIGMPPDMLEPASRWESESNFLSLHFAFGMGFSICCICKPTKNGGSDLVQPHNFNVQHVAIVFPCHYRKKKVEAGNGGRDVCIRGKKSLLTSIFNTVSEENELECHVGKHVI